MQMYVQDETTNHITQYAGSLEVSLDKVPPNHQSLDRGKLEAEASGLLDRMLSVLQESK